MQKHDSKQRGNLPLCATNAQYRREVCGRRALVPCSWPSDKTVQKTHGQQSSQPRNTTSFIRVQRQTDVPSPPPLHPCDCSKRCRFIMWICMESLWAIGLILYYVHLCFNYTNRVNGPGGWGEGGCMGREGGEVGPGVAPCVQPLSLAGLPLSS